MSKIAFVFPGQGSQYIGMGIDFLDVFQEAEEIFSTAERTTGIPVKQLCKQGPIEELTRTINLQPTLTTIDIICAKMLMDNGINPDAVAGHSLGEYPALWASGCLDLADCINLVKERGRLMDEAASANPGSMAAIIGLNRDELEKLISDIVQKKPGILTLANHNSKEQIVATGEKELVSILCQEVKKKGKKAIPLKVSGAYHSPLMKNAAEKFLKILNNVTFRQPSIPLYSNVTAKPESDPQKIKQLMSKQICQPVRWYDIVNNMYNDGIRIFIEAGPKKVLSNLIKKSLDADDIKTLNFESPDQIENIKREIS